MKQNRKILIAALVLLVAFLLYMYLSKKQNWGSMPKPFMGEKSGGMSLIPPKPVLPKPVPVPPKPVKTI